MNRNEKKAEVFSLIERIDKVATKIRFILQNGLTQAEFEDEELDFIIPILQKSATQIERITRK